MHDHDVYPQPGGEDFEDLYTDREELTRQVEEVVEKALPTTQRGTVEMVLFESDVNQEDVILSALNESPRAAITMFLAVTGLSTNDVETALGFSNLYAIADTGDELPHKDFRSQRFAPYILDYLTVDMLRETVVQQTVHRWTLDHRRHYRKEFENEVLTKLEQSGVPLLPDSQVVGQPDIAVPKNNDEMAIVGEIRTTNKQDVGNRIGEFKSEIHDLTEELHVNAKCVIVLKVEEEITPSREKELIQDLQNSVGHLVSGIYTDDELVDLVIDCQTWAPQTQPPLQQFVEDSTDDSNNGGDNDPKDNRGIDAEDPVTISSDSDGDDSSQSQPSVDQRHAVTDPHEI